jgi:hypothetical protein
LPDVGILSYQNTNFDIFWNALEWKIVNILLLFGTVFEIFYSCLVYFWYFGMFFNALVWATLMRAKRCAGRRDDIRHWKTVFRVRAKNKNFDFLKKNNSDPNNLECTHWKIDSCCTSVTSVLTTLATATIVRKTFVI